MYFDGIIGTFTCSLMIFTYSYILIKLVTRSRKMSGQNLSNKSQDDNRKMSTSNIKTRPFVVSGLIVLTYFVFYVMPYFMIQFYKVKCTISWCLPVFMWQMTIIAFSLDPIIYIFGMKKYRRAVSKKYKQLLPRHESRNDRILRQSSNLRNEMFFCNENDNSVKGHFIFSPQGFRGLSLNSLNKL